MKRINARLLGSLLGSCALVALAACQPATQIAEEPKPMPAPLIDRELFFGDPEISGAQLSPDGRFIAFIKPYRGVRNIYVKGIDEPFEAARPATADGRPVTGYSWSQTGRFLLYVQDKDGNENFHVYAVDPTAEAEAESGVPPARNVTDVEGVRAFIYAVPDRRPGTMIVGFNDRDPAFHDVYEVDIATGERKLVYLNETGIGNFTFDLDGTLRLAVRQIPGGGTEVLRLDGDQWTQVTTCGAQETCQPNRFHKDGKRAYMLTNAGEDVDLLRLVLFDPATGEETLVESDPEGEVDLANIWFAPDTEALVATVYVGDRARVYPKNEQVEKDLEILRAALPDGDVIVDSSSHDMRWHLVSLDRDVDPGSVYLYDRESGDVTLQYRSRPELPTEHLAEMKPLRYTARDGLEIPAYLTLPKGIDGKGLPVIVHPHGGPWARDTWGYDSYAQFFANRGYAVFQPNFRSSRGYGKAFLNSGNGTWGTGAMQHDITDGVQHLIDQGIADPERICIFGGSYGGYATLAGVTYTPDLFTCGVPYVGPSNLITLIESFPAYWGPLLENTWYLRVGNPAKPDQREDLIARSPLFSVDQIKVPLLVVHGANDPRVKQHESDQIIVALREKGHDVEYLVAPDEGHGFRAPDNRMALALAMERFFGKHLGGQVQETVANEIQTKLDSLMVDVESVELPEEMQAPVATPVGP